MGAATVLRRGSRGVPVAADATTFERLNVDLVFGSPRTYRRARAHAASVLEEEAMRRDMPSQDGGFA